MFLRILGNKLTWGQAINNINDSRLALFFRNEYHLAIVIDNR